MCVYLRFTGQVVVMLRIGKLPQMPLVKRRPTEGSGTVPVCDDNAIMPVYVILELKARVIAQSRKRNSSCVETSRAVDDLGSFAGQHAYRQLPSLERPEDYSTIDSSPNLHLLDDSSSDTESFLPSPGLTAGANVDVATIPKISHNMAFYSPTRCRRKNDQSNLVVS
jgi:hypothetical protein